MTTVHDSPDFSRPASLNDLLAVTRQVEASIEAGDWVEAARLDACRRPLVESWLAGQRDRAESGQARRVLEAVIAADSKMLSCLEEEKTRISEIARELRTGRAARAAYGGHAR